MSILNPTPQEIDDDKIRTYREYWNPPATAITSPTIEELHNDLDNLVMTESLKPEHFKQTTFIVAGTYAEYTDWLERKGYSHKEYKFVTNAESLRGVSAENLKGIFIGTWRNRSDIDEIRNQIAVIKSKLSDGTLVTGSNGITVYRDFQNYPVSIGGAGGGGFISSGGAGHAATYGTYDVTTTTIGTAEIIREKLHDEIETLSYGDTTRAVILAAIDRVLDKY